MIPTSDTLGVVGGWRVGTGGRGGRGGGRKGTEIEIATGTGDRERGLPNTTGTCNLRQNVHGVTETLGNTVEGRKGSEVTLTACFIHFYIHII